MGGLQIGKVRRRHPSRLGEDNLPVVLVVNHLLQVAGPVPDAHLGKERAQLEILFVRPLLKGMVVAVRADKTDAQEELRRGLHLGVGLVGDQEVVGGRIVVVAAPRREQLVDELVVRIVLGHGLAHPVAEAPHAFLAQKLAIALEQVAPLQRPVVHVLRPFHQLPDQTGAFLPLGRLVLEESLHLVRGGRNADEVKGNAAEKLRVGRGW